MPIVLTNPFNPGELDSKTYPEAKIIEFRMGIEHQKVFQITFEYGETIDGVWNRGKVTPQTILIRDNPRAGASDYTDMIVANPDVYRSVAAILYQKLLDSVSRLSGSVSS